MRKIASLGLVIVLTTSFSAPVNDLVRKEIHEGVSAEIPKSFAPMTKALLREKYVAARRPLAAYTDTHEQVAFGLNVSNTRWQAGDLAMLKDFYRASLLALYDEVDFITEETKEINKRQFAVFEFVSVVLPDEDETSFVSRKPIRQYTYVQYTMRDGKTWVFDFSVPAQAQGEWQETAHAIMNSVRMKPSKQ